MTEPAPEDRVAHLIAQRRRRGNGGLQRIDTDQPAPLSVVQLGLWATAAVDASSAINRPSAARLRGPLRLEDLDAALTAVVERHEPLRTVYPLEGEEPVQRLVDPPEIRAEVVDISTLDESAKAQAVARAERDALDRPFDPTSEIQFDATVLIEAPDSHVVIVSLSHLAFDGWSESVFWADLLEFHAAVVRGREAQLPPLDVRFSDSARWERAQDDEEALDRQRAFWRHELAGLGEAPPMPIMVRGGPASGWVTTSIDSDDIDAVRRMAREENTTPFVILLAAVELMGRELLDAEDFLVKCPVAGRDRPEVHDLVGCFINPMLVRTSLQDAGTRRQLVRAVRSRMAGALANRRLPNFEVVAEFGAWARRPTVARVALQWRDFPSRPPRHDQPLRAEVLPVPTGSDGLSFYVTPQGDAAVMAVDYDTARFDDAAMLEVCHMVLAHLRAICAEPDEPIGPPAPSLAPPDPIAAVEATGIEPVITTIHRQVRRQPDATAVRDDDSAMSYEELWELSGRVATALDDAGVQAGDRVALLTHRGIGQVVAFLGVLRAGAVAVPLDAGLPPGRIELMANTAQARVGVVVAGCGDLTDTTVDRTLHVDDRGALVNSDAEPLARAARPPLDDEAYVFFTSGTTGIPKGIVGSHQGLAHFIAWERSRLGIGPGDVIGAVTGPSFDVSLREILLPLTAGACHTTCRDVPVDRALAWLADTGVSVVHVTPSLAAAWLAEARGPIELPALRWAVFAGEALTGEAVQAFRAVVGPCRVMNFYGPTETCMVKASYEVPPDPRPGVLPVGRPLPFTQLLVLDPRDALCPPGVEGEVVIRTGIGTLGYIGDDPGGFGPNPFVAHDPDGDRSDTVYRTGDLGRYEPDGSVTVQGRLDDQVKIDGIRVEPEETASFLRQHPGVRQCAVVPVEVNGAIRLEAFVVPGDTAPTAGELRRHLRRWLRRSMIPAVFHLVDHIPLTSSNKVDRRAVTAMGTGPAAADEAPTTVDGSELAGVVAEVWADVLACDDIEPSVDFFEAGGTSLRALRILARLEARTGVTAPVDLFFDASTLSEFQGAFAQLASPQREVVAFDTDESAQQAPMSFMQEAMWFESWLKPDSRAYHVDRVFEIEGELDVGELENAVADLEARHEVLRTRVPVDAGKPRIELLAPGSIGIEYEDLAKLAPGDSFAAFEERLSFHRDRSFDLESGPLIRFALFRLGPRRHRFYIGIHHLVVDGWSMRILVDDLGELYSARVERREPQLVELEAQYSDYARRQREREASGVFDAAIAQWERVLADPLPTFAMSAEPRPSGTVPSEQFVFEVDGALAQSFGDLAARLRVTPFMLGVALWSAFLCRKARQDEIILGIPVADRGWAPTEPLVGVFLNTVILRLAAGRPPSLEALLPEVRVKALEALTHSEVPFERVLEVAAPEQRRRGVPLFQVLFQYHHDEDQLHAELSLAGLEVHRLESRSTGAPMDLCLGLNHGRHGTRGRLSYDPRLISADDAVALADEFVEFARATVGDPGLEFPAVDPFAVDGDEQDQSGASPAAPVEATLSFAQERMWFVEQFEPGTSQYMITLLRRVAGDLDFDALERALNRVIARHSVLRSRIVTDEGRPRLFIDPPEPMRIDRVDLTDVPPGDRDGVAERVIAETRDQRFDLAAGRLARVRAIQVGDAEWIMCWSFHHIVIDGLSFRILFRELSHLYRMELGIESAPLPPVAGQYPDFARWQRDRAQSGAYEEHLAFWHEVLTRPLGPGVVPRRARAHLDTSSVQATRALPPDFEDRLRDAARELRMSPYMLSLALWAVAADDGTGEMLVATIHSDRVWPGADQVIGYFVNTLPMRIPIQPGDSLASLARRVRQIALETYQHGEVPLDVILDHVRPEPSVLHRFVNGIEIELFDSDITNHDFELEGVEVTLHPWATGNQHFDLQLTLRTTPGDARVSARGRASLHTQGELDDLVDRFVEAAEQLLDDPSRPLGTGAPTPQADTARELVIERVLRLASAEPDEVAIEGVDETWTRGQIDQLSAAIAERLVDAGVAVDDRVVLALPRSALAVASMYACWRLGAAYVPVDMSQPDARIQAIIEDCAPSVVLSDGSPVPATSRPVLIVDDSLSVTERAAPVPAVADRAAYVVYTSGSTGRPKGVVVSHGAVAAFIDGVAEVYGSTAADRSLQFHSLAFDASVEEIHLALSVGATLVLRPDDLLGSVRRLLELAERFRLSVISVPTAYWHEITAQLAESGLVFPPSVRLVVVGGEAARQESLELWHSLERPPRLINSYGPTETTVAVCCGELADPVAGVHIGTPLPRVSIRIEAVDGRVVEDGEWGELLVAGPQVAIGYLGRPDANAAAFVELDGTRWYRTGDRARRRADGNLEVAGRIDNQVKIDGFRIEPGEVEAVMASLRHIDRVAVVAVEDAAETVLHAFVISTVEIDVEALRRELERQLPPPMVPRHIHQVDELPLTPGEKVDRALLREQVEVTPGGSGGEVVPAGPSTVERMVGLWRELLGHDALDASSDFFESGGRSLTAVRLAYLIENEFGVSVPVSAIFESPTVSGISGAVDALMGRPDTEVESPTTHDDDEAGTDQAGPVEQVEVTPGGSGGEVVPAGPSTVERMVGLWRELLGHDALDASSDFFESGGRSLTAVRLAYLIENEFGVSVPVSAIFESPTVSGISGAVDALMGRPDTEVESPTTHHDDEAGTDPVERPDSKPDTDEVPSSLRTDPTPPRPPTRAEVAREAPTRSAESASPAKVPAAPVAVSLGQLNQPVRLHLDQAPLGLAQQRIWLHQRLRGANLRYTIPVRFRMRGVLDVDRMVGALRGVWSRHEALRTRIVVANGRPVQLIDPPGGALTAAIEHRTLTDVDPAVRLDRAQELSDEFVDHAFDLETEHPYRALLISLSPLDHHLTLLFHHVAIDDRGVALICEDLAAIYHDPATVGVAAQGQFADFAVWQRAQLAEGTYDASIEYWQHRLAEANRLELPGRRPDAAPGGAVRGLDIDLPSEARRRLLGLAGDAGASPFQLLVALMSAFFGRVTGSDDIVIGAPGSERRGRRTDDIVGVFVNTMVLRNRVAESMTFRDLLTQCRQVVGEAIDHGTVPFEVLVDRLKVERDSTRIPLVSVMCSIAEGSGDAMPLPGIDVELDGRRSGSGGVITDLQVVGRVSDQGMKLGFRFDDAVLEDWVVDQLARSLVQFVVAVTADPDRSVGDLPLLDPDEEHWIANGLNQNSAPFPADTRLDESVAQVARRQPDAPAVVDDARRLTYRGLDTEARDLAATLTRLGIGANHTVAVEIDRSADLVVALLGILKAGAVYVPIDRDAPEERRATVLSLAGASAIVTAPAPGELAVEALSAASPPDFSGFPDDEIPAYVMFTSGSTGVPKGAIISHRAIQRTVQNIDYAPLGPGDATAMASNPAFDALTFEVWGALVTGARIEVIDRDTLGDPAAFARALRARRVTSMFLTTSMVNLITSAVPDAFTTLDTLMVGGEAVDVATMRQLTRSGPRRLVNGYGPTECTTFSVWHHVTHVPDDAWTIPIGTATRNTELHVLDARGRLVPRGVVGELCIAGPGVALGYLGDPDLTASRFVEVTVAGRQVRVYRTGDLVRRLPDGVIEYLGRRDHQIKLRGFRIELTDIETALLRNPAIKAAAVKLFGRGPQARLIAYVSPLDGSDLEEASVRRALAEHVPGYMLPARIIVLDELPLTRSGKVDRMALQEPVETEVATVTEDLDGTTEGRILRLWSEVLDRPALGLDDDFFDAGGNSLLGVEALARLDEEHGVQLKLSSLFEARTPRQVAALVEIASASQGATRPKHLVQLRAGDEGATPLWLIHPAGGSLVLYEPMAAALAPHRRIVGVEASGLDASTPALRSIPDLVDHQLETILAEQPHGPYRLLGYSIGGIIGLEVARRLIERGERVEFVGAIEAGVPTGPPVLPSRRKKYGDLLRRADFRGVLRQLGTSLDNRRRVRETQRAARRSELDRAHAEVLASMVHAFHHFEPEPAEVAVILFLGDPASSGADERLIEQWRALALGGLTVRRCSGAHADDIILRSPHATDLAAVVEAELEHCDRGSTA